MRTTTTPTTVTTTTTTDNNKSNHRQQQKQPPHSSLHRPSRLSGSYLCTKSSRPVDPLFAAADQKENVSPALRRRSPYCHRTQLRSWCAQQQKQPPLTTKTTTAPCLRRLRRRSAVGQPLRTRSAALTEKKTKAKNPKPRFPRRIPPTKAPEPKFPSQSSPP